MQLSWQKSFGTCRCIVIVLQELYRTICIVKKMLCIIPGYSSKHTILMHTHTKLQGHQYRIFRLDVYVPDILISALSQAIILQYGLLMNAGTSYGTL